MAEISFRILLFEPVNKPLVIKRNQNISFLRTIRHKHNRERQSTETEIRLQVEILKYIYIFFFFNIYSFAFPEMH